jgi:hypothetical protein
MSSSCPETEKELRPATGNDLVRLLESLADHQVDYQGGGENGYL